MAFDPGELSNAETRSIARIHVGDIDISLAQPIAVDPYSENPRTGRLVAARRVFCATSSMSCA
jgi:bifunctional enzyme CysN/CysC